MLTATVFNSTGAAHAPDSLRPVFSTEPWTLHLAKGKLTQSLPCAAGRLHYSTHNGEMRYRYAFTHNGKNIDVFWRCEKGSQRMFLLKVLVYDAPEVLVG